LFCLTTSGIISFGAESGLIPYTQYLQKLAYLQQGTMESNGVGETETR
jgi:glucose-6-phosphate isomerase